ncbi:hypothetical protein [Streptomyces sp. NPDC053813]
MQQLPALLPSIEEQRRIGDLVCALDSRIGAHHQVVGRRNARTANSRPC